MKSLTILGVSGSIGQRAIEFLRLHRDAFRLDGIAVRGDWRAAHAVAREFGCARIAVEDADAARQLRAATDAEVLDGPAGVVAVAGAGSDVVLAAISGSAGLASVLAAIEAGSQLALANKESVVCGGPELVRYAEAHGAPIVPVDSEHSAIFQCLLSGARGEVHSLLLTASGGPFLDTPLAELRTATVARALAHPNWPMGRKNSLDSATLANKGLELIEASYLFDIPEERIEVVVNPSSIIHSGVHYVDGSMIAQLGTPDMRMAIGYALSWPERRTSGVPPVDLAALGSIRFARPDDARFPCLGLARAALREGQGSTLLFNAANEVAGAAFLDGEIGFMEIGAVVADCLDAGGSRFASPLGAVVEADVAAKQFCGERLRARRREERLSGAL